MKKVRVEIKRVDLYTIIFNEEIWTKEEIKKWSKSFFKAETVEDLAKALTYSIMQNGSDYCFHEGFGYVAVFKNGEQIKHYNGTKKILAKQYTPGIIVRILDENEDFEYDVEVAVD